MQMYNGVSAGGNVTSSSSQYTRNYVSTGARSASAIPTASGYMQSSAQPGMRTIAGGYTPTSAGFPSGTVVSGSYYPQGGPTQHQTYTTTTRTVGGPANYGGYIPGMSSSTAFPGSSSGLVLMNQSSQRYQPPGTKPTEGRFPFGIQPLYANVPTFEAPVSVNLKQNFFQESFSRFQGDGRAQGDRYGAAQAGRV